MKRTIAAALFALLTITAPARAATIYTTNDGGPWLGGGGPAIDSSQYFGVDFTVTTVSQVTGIGGSIISDPRNVGSIFGAILPLSGSSPFPANQPSQLQRSALAGVSFVPTSVPDAFASLSLTLQPGNYALIFGGGTSAAPGPFGATGSAVAVGLIETSLSNPSYIASGGSWEGGTPGNVISCSDGSGNATASNCIRLSVFGSGAGQDFSPSIRGHAIERAG